MTKMTLKQQRFADEYIITGNATQSAIKAGYSQKTARVIANENLTKPYIKEYIEKRMEELQDEKILTQKQILVMLSEIASGKASETVVVTLKKAELIKDPATGKSLKVYNEVAETVDVPTKNSDRNKALELLGKRYKLWTEKVEADVTGSVVFMNEDSIAD